MVALVVLEESTIIRLINDQRFSSTIPCLMNKKDLFKVGGSCGACARKRQSKQRQDMARIKVCLANMDHEKKAELKTLLDAEKVRVIYADSAGKIVQLTF
jgi:hypothetical protein